MALVFERPASGILSAAARPRSVVRRDLAGHARTRGSPTCCSSSWCGPGAPPGRRWSPTLMPIVGISLGFVVLNEQLHPAELLGAALILGGLVLANSSVGAGYCSSERHRHRDEMRYHLAHGPGSTHDRRTRRCRLSAHRSSAGGSGAHRRARRALHGRRPDPGCPGPPPGIGRATIFRALELLTELKLLERLDLPEGEHAYVTCEPSHHHHVVCSTCGRAREVEDHGLQEALDEIERHTGLRHRQPSAGAVRPLSALPDTQQLTIRRRR